ncbi:MAG: hypothetical protein EZS28_014927 [Streblomastix strix]|uniref:Uncharacterized protein n=1 Tax=Streblomastix strix TaxID=222440 RepID=A0A5J4W532_9EUKA|nr:MAG: hypothetical protein EZS28_014927 [Streblomastix strix]
MLSKSSTNIYGTVDDDEPTVYPEIFVVLNLVSDFEGYYEIEGELRYLEILLFECIQLFFDFRDSSFKSFRSTSSDIFFDSSKS